MCQGSELVFYGDSITETWRATDNGRECPQLRCAGVSEAFKHYFGNFSTSVLAVGGEVLKIFHPRMRPDTSHKSSSAYAL